MFGRAAMAGVPIQGMATDKREACVSTEVGQPVSGDQAGDATPVSRGGKDSQGTTPYRSSQRQAA